MMKSPKLRYMLLAVLLMAAVWLGYWIGYMNSIPQPGQSSLDANRAKNNNFHKDGDKLSNKDELSMINSEVKTDKGVNTELGFDSKNLELDTHRGKADIISDSRNNQNQDKETSDKEIDVININKKLDDKQDSDLVILGQGENASSKVGQEIAKDTQFHEFINLSHLLTKSSKSVQKKVLNQSTDINLLKNNNYLNTDSWQMNNTIKKPAKMAPLLPLGEKYLQEHRHREPNEEGYVNPLDLKPGPRENTDLHQDDGPMTPEKDSYYSLIHAGTASRVHGLIHAYIQSLPKTVPQQAYIYTSSQLPSDPALRPSVGNGYLATMIHTPQVYLQGLYNGVQEESHRAEIPSTCSFNITSTDPPTLFVRKYQLNVGAGIYSEVSVSKSYTLTQRIFAHRSIKNLLVVEVDLEMSDISTPIKLMISFVNRWTASYDITFSVEESGMEEVSYKKGRITAPENHEAPAREIHILYDHIPSELAPSPGVYRTKWVFLTSIAYTYDEALAAYHKGRKLIVNNDDLYGSHVKAWADLWSKGRIDIGQNVDLAQTVYGSWYYLLSSLPLHQDARVPFVGLSPCGLPLGNLGQNYQGHVLWDQEIWMYPPLLLLHQDLGKLLVDTRRNTQDGARKNAGQNGGARFATESGVSGLELSAAPDSAKRAYHVTGMVSHAILQYLYATNDTAAFTRDQYVEILSDVANFWVSKLYLNTQKDTYELKGVLPPDISHPAVDNPAFTLALAVIGLAAPEYAFKLVNKTVGDRWQQFINKINIPFDSSALYHPAYDGYSKGSMTYQADTVLLNFPLLRSMPDEVLSNDLLIYEKSTDPRAPPMTWAVHAINWLQLGQFGKAQAAFTKQFAFIRNDFKVWADRTLGEGKSNYLSGMGAFLQSILNGYGGIRLRHDRLDFNPILPPGSDHVNIVGIDYMGSTIDFLYLADEIQITLVYQDIDVQRLKVYIYKTEEVHALQLNKTVKIRRLKGAVITANREYPKEV